MIRSSFRTTARSEHTLFVDPHLSGPNMMMYGEALENSSVFKAALSWSSFMYAPPHSRPAVSCQQMQHWGRFSRLTLLLGLVLDDEGLVLVVHWLREFGRNGMMSGLVLEHETFVAVDTTKDRWLFDGPCADVRPLLLGVLLLCV